MDMTGSYAIAYAIAALLLCAATAIALTVSERLTEREKEWGARASRFLKAELKRAGIGYMELAERLNKHGLEETETSIAGKLARGTFAASFSSPVWRFWRGRE